MPRRKFAPPEIMPDNVIPLHQTGEKGDKEEESKPFFASRIRTLRVAANLSMTELARKLGITYVAVANWESGRTRPDISNIPALCNILNVPISAFFGADDAENISNETEALLLQRFRSLNDSHQRFVLKMLQELKATETDLPAQPRLRLLGLPYAMDDIAAGIGADGFEAACRTCYVHDVTALRDTDILFKVNGDSMEPEYADGCTVRVKKTPEVGIGEVGVFSVDGALYIKVRQADGLHSLNTKYPPMLSKKYDEIYAIGKVLGIMDQADFATAEEIESFQAQE